MNNQIAVLIVHISIAVLQQPEKSITSLLLKKTEDGTTVSFDNIPFFLEVRILDCQYGEHYFKKRENGNKRLWLQGSRKTGCQANIKIKSYTTYPDYVLPDTTNMTTRQVKQAQHSSQ